MPVAPLTTNPMNITTGMEPLSSDNVQKPVFSDAAFMRDPQTKEIVSLQRQILDPSTGQKFQENPEQTQNRKPAYDEPQLLACVDDASRKEHKGLLSFERALNTVYPNSNIRLRPTAKSNNERGVGLWIPVACEFYQDNQHDYRDKSISINKGKDKKSYALICVSKANVGELIPSIVANASVNNAIRVQSIESKIVSDEAILKQKHPEIMPLENEFNAAFTSSSKLYPLINDGKPDGYALWINSSDPLYEDSRKTFNNLYIRSVIKFNGQKIQGIWIQVNDENAEQFLRKLGYLIRDKLSENNEADSKNSDKKKKETQEKPAGVKRTENNSGNKSTNVGAAAAGPKKIAIQKIDAQIDDLKRSWKNPFQRGARDKIKILTDLKNKIQNQNDTRSVNEIVTEWEGEVAKKHWFWKDETNSNVAHAKRNVVYITPGLYFFPSVRDKQTTTDDMLSKLKQLSP